MVDPTESEDCCFCPDATTNATRGSTVKQSDADPFQEKMRKAMEARVGKVTNVYSGMECDHNLMLPPDQ